MCKMTKNTQLFYNRGGQTNFLYLIVKISYRQDQNALLTCYENNCH